METRWRYFSRIRDKDQIDIIEGTLAKAYGVMGGLQLQEINI